MRNLFFVVLGVFPPLLAGRAAEIIFQRHEKRIAVVFALCKKVEPLLIRAVEPRERLFEHGAPIKIQLAVIYTAWIVAPVDIFEFLSFKQAVLAQHFEVYKIVIKRERRERGIRAVAVRGGQKRQNLPQPAARGFKVVRKTVRRFAQRAYPALGRQRRYGHQYARNSLHNTPHGFLIGHILSYADSICKYFIVKNVIKFLFF